MVRMLAYNANAARVARVPIRGFGVPARQSGLQRHLPAGLASARFLPSPVGSGKMRNLLAEYRAWFEPDEVQILVGAFDKAWGPFKPLEWSTRRLRPKLCGRYSQNIL